MLVAIIVLSALNIVQLVIIWQLISRLLIQSHLLPLTPVPITAPVAAPAIPSEKKKLFRVSIPD